MKATQILLLLFIGCAVGCILWFGLYSDVHDFSRKISIEDRHAEQVGAKPIPLVEVKILIKNSPRSCAQINSADFDGVTITVAYQVTCAEDYMALRWKQRSPDGTVIDIGYTWIWASTQMERGDRGNFTVSQYSFHFDPRTSVVELSASR